MNTKTVTAQNCSLFEIDAELEEAFDQLQEEREITGTISNESRERCVQLFAELVVLQVSRAKADKFVAERRSCVLRLPNRKIAFRPFLSPHFLFNLRVSDRMIERIPVFIRF